MAAEYVFSEGNRRVFLCERGVRTFADHSRNTLDLAIIPSVKALSHLPILVDPSHGTGRRDQVLPLALALVLTACVTAGLGRRCRRSLAWAAAVSALGGLSTALTIGLARANPWYLVAWFMD